jgi:hypothetical protein
MSRIVLKLVNGGLADLDLFEEARATLYGVSA